jgi:hypothetical protein
MGNKTMVIKPQAELLSHLLETEAVDRLFTLHSMGRLPDGDLCRQLDRISGAVYFAERYMASNKSAPHNLKVGSLHDKAQEWGMLFVLWFLRTGIGANEAKEAGDKIYVPKYHSHLRNCWKHDHPDERCEILGRLVDATDMHTLEQEKYVLYYQGLLEKAGIHNALELQDML